MAKELGNIRMVLCNECTDIICLHKEERKCKCGKSKGHYIDPETAVYSGDSAVPLMFSKSSLIKAVRLIKSGANYGMEFVAFALPANTKTFKKSIR